MKSIAKTISGMSPSRSRMRIWDWTLRAVHWSWVLLLIAMWWTAEQNFMEWHKWLGLLFIGLLTYRLAWGLIGPSTARLAPLFTNLVRIPAYILGIIRGSKPKVIGHNPLGGLSVIAMLLLMVFQLTTGLMAVDVDGLASGWFGHLVSFEMGRTMSDLHDIGFNVLLGLIGVHVFAIAIYYIWLKDNLLAPMITGWRRDQRAPNIGVAVEAKTVRICCALIVGLMVAGLVLWLGR